MTKGKSDMILNRRIGGKINPGSLGVLQYFRLEEEETQNSMLV
jgi:hypothetical protein